MAFSSSTSPDKPAARRLRPATIARRCVGSLIVLAGASILTLDMIALASGAQRVAVLAAADCAPNPR